VAKQCSPRIVIPLESDADQQSALALQQVVNIERD